MIGACTRVVAQGGRAGALPPGPFGLPFVISGPGGRVFATSETLGFELKHVMISGDGHVEVNPRKRASS